MLTIKKAFNFEEFEIALSLARVERQIRLPTQFSHTGKWGIDVTLIQLLLTWARANETAEIKTYIEDNDAVGRSKQLSDWGKRLFGIAALYLTKGLVTAQGTPIPKEEYSRYCTPVLRAMNYADIHSEAELSSTSPGSSGVAAQFVCLHGSRFEFLNSLYHSPSRDDLLSRKDFSFLVKSALESVPTYADFLNQKPEIRDHLANLIYELFQNTNDHGYDDLDGSVFKSNLRAFSIKSHSVVESHKHLSGMESNNQQFNEYLEFCERLFTQRGIKTQRFLELSIVDGGLGYAQKLKGKPLDELDKLDLSAERQATEDCFKRGVSSKSSQSRGEGLDEVWKALCELNGFIRLRTGRLCLFQTFHNRTADDPRAFSLWTNDALEQVSGTAVTIIIPCVS